LADPPNGDINFGPDTAAPFDFETQAQYICDDGYELSGDGVLTCGDGFEWIGVIPTCQGTV